MTNSNLFEVFLGTFNAETWIENLIHSLEAQETDPFSVVIVDNDSSDKTVEVIEKLFDKYTFKNNYRLIKNEKNIGAISSFLDRLDLFNSEWVFMIHQDDFYHSDHIETLKNEISRAEESKGIFFTAMERIDGKGKILPTPPTLSSKLSDNNRLENFILSLQISPINFPACALRKSVLEKVDTTRHTTAFNDMELLLRMMCISDVKYVPKETMHYRVYEGNSASTTSQLSNDRAVLIGMNEIFHSLEFNQLVEEIKQDQNLQKLVNGINQAIEIRISSKELQNLLRNILAEVLIRKFGYRNKFASDFLIQSLISLGLPNESKLVGNLSSEKKYKTSFLVGAGEFDYSKTEINIVSQKNFRVIELMNRIPLMKKDKFFDRIFTGILFVRAKRPFVKVWRSVGRHD